MNPNLCGENYAQMMLLSCSPTSSLMSFKFSELGCQQFFIGKTGAYLLLVHIQGSDD